MEQYQKWMQYEISAVKYLEKKIGKCATIQHEGKHDSTVPDILVTSKSTGNNFYVEVKQRNSQSGQLVVLLDNKAKRFVFSSKNKTKQNSIDTKMIDYLNKNWEKYKSVSTKGLNIDLPSSVFCNWIIDYYKKKNVKFFMSGDIRKPTFIPINDFAKAFEVTACYRKKRSGTSELKPKYENIVKKYILQNIDDLAKFEKDSKNTVLITSRSVPDSIRVLDADNRNFLLKKDESRENTYKIRTQSNTNNPNIIFSINLKSEYQGALMDDIIKEIK